jgi:hypothetical protein
VRKALVSSPRWDAVETIVLSAIFFLGLWKLGPSVQDSAIARLLFWLLVGWGAFHILWFSPMVLHRDPPEWRGWGRPAHGEPHAGAWRSAWRVYALLTATVAGVLLAVAMWRNPSVLADLNWKAFWIKFLGYAVFGPVQALIFFGFIQARLRAMIPQPAPPRAAERHRLRVATAVAAVFALYHLPNLPLIAITFVVGGCWAWVFYKFPNIMLLGLSHAVLGTILHRVIGLHMRIGPFYAEPQRYILRNTVPGLKALIGNLF